ncbi:MAG: undecaprenyl/decaprenyl-phosphate alpha-N-acetylglucosaminyl 1-phosphate transferase [Prevotellaceae bacterium]|jgi:UDP-N-acetylmuramyl pentapeptide phosphotransferase/UDP-N-acetylglucosamine-1-phosphate transferase|nr:undecaprenyl/decaprenyl-phosphate alpha-N-acetylglucosaminyl 1-phosphate transferase [Prevotellaceae bacterium]
MHFFDFLNIASKYPFIGTMVTFSFGLLIMPLVLKFAKKRNLVVRPNKRTVHNGAVPNIGGLDIFCSLLTMFILLMFFNRLPIPFLVGFCLMFVIGFIDDKLVLSAYWKLAGETLCAFFLIYNYRITSLYGIFGVTELPLFWSCAISYFVFILIVNALNLIDGIDGLASGLGIVYCLFFGFWFYLVEWDYYALFCFSCFGSLLVFFIYNVFGSGNRKIFMGDSGSLVLGYLITFFIFQFLEINAKMPINNEIYRFPYAFATVISVLFIPLFDIFRVAFTRIKHHVSPFSPDRNHIHHLLLRLGLKHKQVTLILLLVSLFFVALAILCKNVNFWVQITISLLSGILLIFLLWRIVDKKEIILK